MFRISGRILTLLSAIKNTIAWAGHLGSKAHRTNVARLKAEEEEAHQKLAGKRKAPESEPDADIAERDGANGASNKKQRGPTEFPNGFFSDSSRPVPISNDDDDDEPPPSTPPEQSAEMSAIDKEWEEFQRTVIDAPVPIIADQRTLVEDSKRETFDRATVFAEPEIVSETPEGFPERRIDEDPSITEEAKSQEPTEEELREKKRQEEKELIMDRLLAEEQAQEDADNRVAALKARLEGIKKRKEAARLLKQKQ